MNWKLERERERERLTIQSASERSSLGVHWTHTHTRKTKVLFEIRVLSFLFSLSPLHTLIVDNCNFATVCQQLLLLLLPFSIFFCLFCLFTAIQFNRTSLAPHPPLSCAASDAANLSNTISSSFSSFLLCLNSRVLVLVLTVLLDPAHSLLCIVSLISDPMAPAAAPAISIALCTHGTVGAATVFQCWFHTLCVCISPLLYFSQADAINSKAVTVVVVAVADVPSSHRAELK